MKKLLFLSPFIATIALVALKLFGVIQMSWGWVISPFWITVALFLLIVAVGTLVIKSEERFYHYRVIRKAKKRAIKNGSYNPKRYKTKYVKTKIYD